jgi:hypothetical protein
MMYISSELNEAELGLLFGVLQTTVSVVLDGMIRRVVDRLRDNPLSRIKLPDEQEKRRYADLVAAREPRVTNVIGFLDGVAIPIKCSFEDNQRYHSSYHAGTFVNNILLFSPEGTILYAAFNYPGECLVFSDR